jgi:cyclopropane-fatty-acyl-phospholipid synthase
VTARGGSRVASPAAQSLALLADAFAGYAADNFAIRAWDGAVWEANPGRPVRFTLVLEHPGAARRMLWPPTELSLAEAYVYGDVDLEGDVEGAMEAGRYLLTRPRSWLDRLRLVGRILRQPRDGMPRHGRAAARLTSLPHSRGRDRQAVRYHYDVSVDFYRLFLDHGLVYSCAYFTSPDQDVEAAQAQKLDYICRKLRLVSGERLLDIGCGWGGLVIHAAKRYGTRTLGITLSERQAEVARERIRDAGVADLASVEVRDYRDVPGAGVFDKVVSIGMVEHVGHSRLGAYFEQAWRLLRPGGVFLSHGLASHPVHSSTPSIVSRSRRPGFAQRYVFPDSELVPIAETTRVAEGVGFELRDLENLREHYVLTARAWVRRLSARWDEACRITDRATYRTWILALAGGAYGLCTGQLSVHQALFVKPDSGLASLPLTRSDWYQAPAPPSDPDSES